MYPLRGMCQGLAASGPSNTKAAEVRPMLPLESASTSTDPTNAYVTACITDTRGLRGNYEKY
jgi:hypothetical protein